MAKKFNLDLGNILYGRPTNKKPNLAKIRKEVTGELKHREWRGIEDTAYDYYRWLNTWKSLGCFIGRAPVQTVKGLFRYRWMSTYLATPEFIDRATAGQRGIALKTSHIHYNALVEGLTDVMTKSFKADQNIGGSKELSDKIIGCDELVPPLLFAGFPTCDVIPAQFAPLFIASMVDQHYTEHYLDAIEYYGVPADVCPLPSGEAGVAVEDDYPKIGKCFISSNMPCDGSIMTSSFQDRRFNLPTFPLAIPLRYNDELAQPYAVAELKDCIEFVEKQMDVTFDWDALRSACEIYNLQTSYELEKWDFNMGEFPQVTGATLWLYRLFYFQAAQGKQKYLDTDEKVNKLISKNYEKGKAGPNEIRHRAVLWSCPANYYTDFPVWLENTWGIVSLIDMETQTSTGYIDTSTNETMLADIAKTYQRATMRRHTKGGYAHILDKLWETVEEFNADMVVMYDQISCKGMDGISGLIEEQARERNIKLVWIAQDLMDPSTISRREMRQQMNKYMYNVMKEEPLDESLVDFDDNLAW